MIRRFLHYIKSQGFDVLFLIGLIFAAGLLYQKVESNSSDIKSVETRLTSEMKAIESRLATEMQAIEKRLATRIDKGFEQVDKDFQQIGSRLQQIEGKLEEIGKDTIVHETRLNRIEEELANISK